MKLFTKEQIYKGDQLTLKNQNIEAIDLVARAGKQTFNWFDVRMGGAQVPIHIFCGIGNNGAVGLAAATEFVTHGYNVNIYIINCSDKRSKEFLINYDRVKSVSRTWPLLLTDATNFPQIHQDDIIIDAVFGIGLNRPIDDWIAALFLHFKQTKAYTVSVDIPSGLFLDKLADDDNAVVYAGHTLSFTTPKTIFFLPTTSKYSLQWDVLDIGVDMEYLYDAPAFATLIGKNEVLPLYIPRKKTSHKGTYGHSIIIGGSYGKIGAAILATKATLASGAGLVTSYLPKCGYIPMQSAFPEAMVITDDANEKLITEIEFDVLPNAIGIGVGMGTDAVTIKAFKDFLQKNKSPLVIDADGLNMLALDNTLLKLLPAQTILTPHEKELERLIGSYNSDFDKIDKAVAFSKQYDVILVIKGANTLTIYKDEKYFNTTGNPGLATAGTGDVLTGVLTGLLSQGYTAINTCLFGVYLHGKAADIAINLYGYQSLLATHVIDYIGEAYLDLFKQPEQEPKTAEETEKAN